MKVSNSIVVVFKSDVFVLCSMVNSCGSELSYHFHGHFSGELG